MSSNTVSKSSHLSPNWQPRTNWSFNLASSARLQSAPCLIKSQMIMLIVNKLTINRKRNRAQRCWLSHARVYSWTCHSPSFKRLPLHTIGTIVPDNEDTFYSFSKDAITVDDYTVYQVTLQQRYLCKIFFPAIHTNYLNDKGETNKQRKLLRRCRSLLSILVAHHPPQLLAVHNFLRRRICCWEARWEHDIVVVDDMDSEQKTRIWKIQTMKETINTTWTWLMWKCVLETVDLDGTDIY